MKQTQHLTVVGIAGGTLQLLHPDGSKLDFPVQNVPASVLSTITLALKNPTANWNGSGKAPIKVIVDVQVDDATGEPLSFTVMAVSIEND